MLTSISVALTPAEAAGLPAECYVVIDVLRATTTIATLFERGLRKLTVVSEIGLARELAAEQGALLLGEEGGLPPPGFALGNSPVDAAKLMLSGRDAVMFTTNGTAALCGVAGKGTVYAGALANVTAVAEAAARFGTTTVVCSGGARGSRFGLDDFAAAAVLVGRLTRIAPEAVLSDGAELALQIVEPARLVRRSEHAGTLRLLRLAADIEFALREDSSPAVPAIVDFGEGYAVLRDVREG